jgi:hypothetical protein
MLYMVSLKPACSDIAKGRINRPVIAAGVINFCAVTLVTLYGESRKSGK